MENIFCEKVYYSDTDAYGVVWHGAYLRWLEKGRVLFCEDLGLNLSDLSRKDIALPVTSINLKYKSSARLNDIVMITTKILKKTGFSLTFSQTVTNPENKKVYVSAEVTVVSISNEGKLYKRFPEILDKAFSSGTLCCV